MDNSVTTTTTTTVTTIEHCGTKGFPPTPPSSPQDLINNNSNPSTKRGSFGSTIMSTNSAGDLQPNNESKSTAVNRQQLQQYDHGGLESSSGSVPDADLTESLATATEALTEILVNTTNAQERDIGRNNGGGTSVVVVVVQDDNGNENVPSSQLNSPKPQHYTPNVSSSSTQTECPPSSSYLVCCCNDWSRWKSASLDNKRERVSSVRCQSPSSGGRRCCHHLHRRKKTNATATAASNQCGGNESCSSSSSSGETKSREKVTVVATVSTKYSKSWRELRKATSADGKRSAEVVICRLQATGCSNNARCGNVRPM